MGKELVVPLLVVGILSSMLLPVPPAVMDFLLVANLIGALVLLMSTLYITDTIKLSSLPSLLLLATLFRLALNISTTRNILSSGDAGRVVEAFGHVVIQGNLVVGTIIFLIITLVQFIVIAKGAERVAEVSARFTLDALPGKQMSIDADVRAGLIDFSAARAKRQDLQTESRFYGALDGAMKFVKGDAIAGMVIIIINILGGLIIAIFGDGLELQSAISKYTLLSVGDGIAAQIPALLNSLAAGIIVTRVGRGEEISLAAEVINQMGQIQSVKVLIGIFALVIGVIPGMPGIPFMSLACMLLISAVLSRNISVTDSQREPEFSPKAASLIAIELCESVSSTIMSERTLINNLEKLRQHCFDSTGLILPFPEIKFVSEPKGSFAIKVRGIEAFRGELSNQATSACSQIAAALQKIINERAQDFVDDILTRRTLDNFDNQFAELVTAVVPGIISVTQLTDILKNLVLEDVSIKNFDVILQAVAEFGPKAASERTLLEEVRIALRWAITKKFSNSDGIVKALVLDPVLDMLLSKAEKDKAMLDLEQITVMADFVKENREAAAAVVVSRGARRLLREYLKLKGVDFPVIAFEELVDGFQLEVVRQLTPNSKIAEDLVERLAA